MTMEDLDYLLDRIAFLEDRLTQIESKLGYRSVYGTQGVVNTIHTTYNNTPPTTTHLSEVHKEIQRLKAEAQAKTLIPPTKSSSNYYSDIEVSLEDDVATKGIVNWYNEYYRSHKSKGK
jgi:hypothetical protein